jgi:microcin C transport system substrate-binding protein
LLDAVRDKVPPEIFTKPYTNPVNGNLEAVRANLREALRLLKQAGYEVRDQQLVTVKTGEPYAVEFLTDGSGFERVFLFYKSSLYRLGMATTLRTVDEVQYQNRLRSWDFDIITSVWPQTLTPGNELHGYWGSGTAENPAHIIGLASKTRRSTL